MRLIYILLGAISASLQVGEVQAQEQAEAEAESQTLPPTPTIAKTIAPEEVPPLELNNAWIFSGGWTYDSGHLTVPDADISANVSSFEGNMEMKFLYQVGEGYWFGPFLGFGFERITAEDSSSIAKLIYPGLELKKTIPTTHSSYIAPSVFVGWAFASESSASIDADYDGLGFGGSLAFGSRLGEEEVYIIESAIKYCYSAMSGTASDGSGSADLDANYGRVLFAISIGKLF